MDQTTATLNLGKQRLLIVGYGAVFHVGAHLYQAALQLGIEVQLFDASAAYKAPRLLRQINWRVRSHRPTLLDTFSQKLLEHCSIFKPDVVLVTGITPPNAQTISLLRDMGIVCVNFLTDDPWNPNHHSKWFFEALPYYSQIFSPRKRNLNDLAHLGCQVSYLPFAYNPALHFREAPPPEIQDRFQCDILFYGGADSDRIPYIEKLINLGFKVHLYGGFWNRYAQTRSVSRGMADSQTLRWAVAGAKITLCLVRKANRDGHVMRTFEAPAMGACMLTEDTAEHQDILGVEGVSATYFNSLENLVDKAYWLCREEGIRTQLEVEGKRRILNGKNAYVDRLFTVLQQIELLNTAE